MPLYTIVPLYTTILRSCLLTSLLVATGLSSRAIDVFSPLELSQIKVGGEIGRRIGLTVTGNLLQIDLDKDFLAPFAGGKYTGLNDGSGQFTGIGKTLDGMVRLAAVTGDEALIARKNHVVKALIESQESDGYIGMLPPANRTWGLWDIHEEAFIITGLVNDYNLFHATSSLDAARKLGNYLITRWPGKPADWEKKLPVREYFAEIGLSSSFILLAAATGDARYLDFVVNELGEKKWNLDIVLGRRPPVDGHTYMYLSHCLAQLQLNRLEPDEKLLVSTKRAVDFMTDLDGMLITGGVGQDECWTDDQSGAKNLGETCSTAYQLFVFDSLLRLDGESRWGDLIERNLYNAAFAAQSPDGRRIRYYTPLEGPRVYFEPDSYCCPGNFRRLMGFAPQLIYYRAGNGVAVDLYSPSEATFDQINGTALTIRQKTDYPSTGKIALEVEPAAPVAFPLLLRIPRWSSNVRVTINGQDHAGAVVAGGFLKIDRTWRPGDQVSLDLPMPWRFVAGRQTQAGRVAVMRGPLVYTLNPAQEAALKGVDLKRLVLLTATAELIAGNEVSRPNGTACRIKADLDQPGEGRLSLTLTEFPDPEGQWTYFKTDQPNSAVSDELLTDPKPVHPAPTLTMLDK